MFEVTADPFGDLRVAGGKVRNLAGTVVLDAGPADGVIFLGGSGRNLWITGLPGATAPNGIWRYVRPGLWETDGYRIELANDGSAAMLDDTDTIATLASGGPTGNYTGTTYGNGIFGSGFGMTASAETTAPGTLPDATLTVSAGTFPAGTWVPTSATEWELSTDSTKTITVASTGRAELRDATGLVAIRTAGSPCSPEGLYVATVYGQTEYHPGDSTADSTPDSDPDPTTPPSAPATGSTTTEDDADVILPGGTAPDPATAAPVNPFGVLSIRFSWVGSEDLDTGTTFLGDTVGYGHGTAPFMTWTGDDVSASGDEEIEVDLAAAWAAGEIVERAYVDLSADWFPSAGGSGPATLVIEYSRGPAALVFEIHPGGLTPSTTPQMTLRIDAGAAAPTPLGQPWSATVALVPEPAPEGVVYVKVTEDTGVLDAVEPPAFATSLPANSGDDYHVLLASIDAAGLITTEHSGVLFWR